MNNIEEFLKSDQQVLYIPMMPYQEVNDKLELLGYIQDDLDSNGWQHDFWVTYRKGDHKIKFCGSWAWGNYVLSKEY